MAWGRETFDAATAVAKAHKSKQLHVLPSVAWDDQQKRHLVRQLRQHPRAVDVVALSGHTLPDDAARQLGALLADPHCSLRELKVGDAHFGLAGVAALADGAHDAADAQPAAASVLETLELDYKALDAAAARHIGCLVLRLPRLTRLALSRNPLSDEGVELLLSALGGAPAPRLLALELSEAALTAAAVDSLAREVIGGGALASLERLHLSRNDLGNVAGGCAVGALVAGAKSLASLWVEECGLCQAGATALGDALAASRGCSLEALHLGGNPLGAAGSAIARGLATLERLQHLGLGGCELDDGTASAISGPLRTLALARNRLTAAGVEVLLATDQLVSLSVFGNASVGASLSALPTASLSAALRGATSLRHLDVGGCQLESSELCEVLAEDAAAAPSLRVLELGANPFSASGAIAAIHALREARPALDVVWKPLKPEV